MVTKLEIYEQLRDEFDDALPQTAYDCDVSISEAIADKFTKEYSKFRETIHEQFALRETAEMEEKQ